MDDIFRCLEQQTCFAGHTHTAGIFTADYQFLTPASLNGRFELDGRKVIINVGSVGQPRDGDPNSSYVIFDGKSVEFRRVTYDIERTVKRFRDIPVLPEYLAHRLVEGR